MAFSTQIFAAPGRYVQGAGTIRELGAHVGVLGSRVLTVGGRTGLEVTREGRQDSFRETGLSQVEAVFGGETSDGEIGRLADLGRRNGCDVLLASGGGKVIDAVKAAAEELGVPAAVVPTVASNDAPCSALAVLYHEDGTFDRLRPLRRSPGLVLVDTEIIAHSPVRTLVAGMGDALATWFEADACHRADGLNNFGGHVSITALALARLCLDTLLEYGAEAKHACESSTVTEALEKVVEANTLLSGLGFESGGVSAAHALSEGFSVIPELHGCLHGETVAFGLLAQLALENRPAAVTDEITRFCLKVGLPVTLSDLGAASVGLPALRRAADISAAPGKPSRNMPFPVTGQMLFEAILAADAYGSKLKGESIK